MSADHPIGELQQMLRVLVPDAAPFEAGVYGERTRAAVARFQKARGMRPTGEVDERTWEELKRAYQNEQIERRAAEPLEIILQPHQVLEKGCQNSNVYLVQAMLRALDNYVPDMPVVDVNGRMDAKTEKAIRWLQACCGLPQSGDLDKNTWRFLAHEYRSMVGDGTGAFPVRQHTPTQQK